MHVWQLKFLRVFIPALVGLSFGCPARADSPARPDTYTKPSPDGRFLFVMLSPRPPAQDTLRSSNSSDSAKLLEVRAKYTQSGLYRNDGSATPLWTVNWYSFDVDVASDGVHLVRRGPWASRTSDEAFSFFASGKLIRTYRISELVDAEFLLSHSVSHFMWARRMEFDDGKLQTSVSTYDGNSFVLDVTTGQIVDQRLYAKWWVCLVVLYFGATIGAFWYLCVKLFRIWAAGKLRLPARVWRIGVVIFCGWLVVINGPLMFLAALTPSRSETNIEWLVGAILNVAVGLLGVRYVLHVESRDRRAARRSAGLCENCGYDLRATPTGCTECGTAVSVAPASPIGTA